MDALREKWLLDLVMELHQHIEDVYTRLAAARTETAAIEEVPPMKVIKSGETVVVEAPPVVMQNPVGPVSVVSPQPLVLHSPIVEPTAPKEEKPKRTRKPAAGQVELPPAGAIIIPEDLTDIPVSEVAIKFNMASKIIGREATQDIFEKFSGKRSLAEVDRKFYTDIFVALKEEVKRVQALNDFNL